MGESLLSGNIINRVTGVSVELSNIGKMVTVLGVCDVTTTAATVFDIKQRQTAGRSDTVIGTIPVGAEIVHVALRVPSGLVATNGDRLKLATAVGATGTQAFNATASTAYVASAVAASTTFAPDSGKTDQYVKFEVSPYSTTGSTALSGAVTFKVYNDNGTTAAGSGVSVASGTAQIVAMIVYRLPVDCPRLDQIAGRPTRTT